jgi:hypothetical protein
MALTRANTRTRPQTSALSRNALHTDRIEQAKEYGLPFRRRVWLVLGWLMAEIHATPEKDREQFLDRVQAMVRRVNERRQR